MNREQMVAPLFPETARLQYDDLDSARMANASELLALASELFRSDIHIVQALTLVEADENSADAMKELRFNLVNDWSVLARVISELALIFRIDGDTAFERMIAAKREGLEEADMNGL